MGAEMDDQALWGPQPPLAPAGPDGGGGPGRRQRAPLLVTALVVVLAVTLAMVGLFVLTRGGGKDDSPQVTSETTSGRPSPAVVLGAAPAATRGGGTAQIRTSMRSFDGGDSVKEVVTGVVGFDTGAYDLSYSFDAGPGNPAGLGDSERVFSDGTTVWSVIPPYMDFVPELMPGAKSSKAKNPFKGKKYLAEETGQLSAASEFGVFGQQALGFSIGTAPGDVLDYLSGVGSAVEEGKEQIDGTEVTRYGADLDLDALQRALPSEERYFDAYDFKPDVKHTFPAKVWLDGDGRLRKLTYRLDLSGLLTDVALNADFTVEECPDPDPVLVKKAEAGDRKAMASLFAADEECTGRPPRPEELVIEGSVEISSFGTPLGVVAPPPAEVVTSDELDAFFAAQANEAIASGAFPPVPGP